MGQVRSYDYDAVIGVGGKACWPGCEKISGRINWVGIEPSKSEHREGHGVEVSFKHFLLLDEAGPLLEEHAPALAKRMYEGGARFLLSGYSPEEYLEAKNILAWSRKCPQPKQLAVLRLEPTQSCQSKCEPKPALKRQC